MKANKVGSFTLGLTLIVFGFLFLLHTLSIPISYMFIFRLWPIMFLLLGGEILFHYFHNREERISIDAGSFILFFLLGGFAVVMAIGELAIEYYKNCPQ